MSRGAFTLSLALHAAIVAVACWATLGERERPATGRLEIGVTLAASGLLEEDAPPATAPPLAVEAPSAEPAGALPPPPVGLRMPLDSPLFASIAVTATPRELSFPSAARKTSAPNHARPAPAVADRGGTTDGKGNNAGEAGGMAGYLPPHFLMRYKPPYPDQARAERLQGMVILRVAVDPAGHVASAQLAQSSGHEILDRAALLAVRSWRFVPARQGDRNVPATVEVPIRFNLAA